MIEFGIGACGLLVLWLLPYAVMTMTGRVASELVISVSRSSPSLPEVVSRVLLHALAGYDAQPSGLQLAFYVSTLVVIAWAKIFPELRLARTFDPPNLDAAPAKENER